ncbi:hypothetical protein GWK47_013413 [Chionoecetes opilio]|uniref:Uncharacterized protein n=1 Tax=Chionoecetes opilio TaxID=41210 RepID=A0A8J4Y4M5_CHIOP|nr:hypothetical protein GWK47_013413 [Chionoecetes opilio]
MKPRHPLVWSRGYEALGAGCPGRRVPDATRGVALSLHLCCVHFIVPCCPGQLPFPSAVVPVSSAQRPMVDGKAVANQEEKKTVQQSAAEAAKEVLDFWTRARIPTIAETSVRRKITGLFDKWKILSKSKNNSGVTPAEKQKTFQESLPDLLDIAHSDALTLMTIPEDKEFLLAQREKGRRGSMAGLDKKLKESVCRHVNECIRKACFTTLSRHFWYLSEDLIGLSLFDSRLPVSDKQAIVQAILYDEGAEEPAKRINLPSSQVPAATLPSFATKNSLRLFEALDIKTDFLSANPRKWQEEELYFEACRRIEGLRVVNDTAERGVALIQSFNLRLTKDEEQRQFLLQVVEAHRHQQPGTSKASLPRPSRPQ